MKIVKGYPPIIDKIREKFELRPTIVFTWGDTIFSPAGEVVNPDVIVHEQVHEKQQRGDPAKWWDRYLEDTEFRFNQELEAYRVQYKFYMKGKDRNKVFMFIHRIAGDLSGGMYGNIVSYEKAKRLIKV